MTKKKKTSRRKSRSNSKSCMSRKTNNFRVWSNALWRGCLDFAKALVAIEYCLKKTSGIVEAAKHIFSLFICLYLLQKRIFKYDSCSSPKY